MGLPNAPYYPANTTSQDLVDNGAWQNASNQVNPNGMFLSKIDLENDIALELEAELLAFAGETDVVDAIKYLQGKKAIRMREFISQNRGAFVNLVGGELAKPLAFAVAQVTA